MDCSTPGFPIYHQRPDPAQTHVHRVGDAIQLSHSQSSPSPPAFSLFKHQGLFNESVLYIRWPKYWSFSFSISPSNEYSGLISLRIDWFDLLAVQGALKSLLQNHSSKASVLQHSAFFMVQFSHPYMKVLNSIYQQIWKTQQWPQDWKRSVFIPIPKKGNAKAYSNYHTIALISHASKVMLKILQARLQQYVNRELPDVQAGFRKGKGTRE